MYMNMFFTAYCLCSSDVVIMFCNVSNIMAYY